MAYGVHNGRGSPGSFRLEPGSHASPHNGVCIVELASVIGGEPFSDHPDCVCQVIAAFLRSWNDRSSHSQRQQLLPYADRVVGSRAGGRITRRRRDVCLTWAGADLTGNRLSRVMRRLAMRARMLVLCGVRPALRLNEGAGELAARAVFARYGSGAALQLVDTLLAVGSDREPPPRRAPNGSGDGTLNGSGGAPDPELLRVLVEPAAPENNNGHSREPAAPGNNNGHSRDPAGVA
jgi:hypothetical protein